MTSELREGDSSSESSVSERKGSRIVPLALGIAMLAVVLTAGLFPNAGTVQAQSSCPYGGCTTSSSVPVWEYVSILVVIAVAAILALLFIMRRRRPPRATMAAAGAAGGAAAAPPAWGEDSTAPAGPSPSYLETPEDIGHAPPSVVTPATATPAEAAGGAAAGTESSSDIDSLMAELDKISTEILKKPPAKGAAAKGAEEAEDAEKSA